MKYLITGYKGQLGYDIKRELLKRGVSEEDILAIDKEEMDITDSREVSKIVNDFKPNVIFHCAAWTAVDKAEDMSDACYNVNVVGTKNIVDASLKVGATIIYMSTDYVFDGTKDGLYTEEDIVNPKSVYGRTKFLGEEEIRRNPKHFITRISWVFGINGHNFIRTMLKLAENHQELNVVDDQVGSPTYTVDLASIINQIIIKQIPYGIYNATNIGSTSWYELAKKVLTYTKSNCIVNPISTQNSDRKAVRPKNSRLDVTKLLKQGIEIPTYDNALERFLKIELKEM